MKFKIITLGCKVNQAESEQFRRDFISAGLKEAGSEEPADLVVVNTCCVTGIAERKSRKAIRHSQQKNPKAKLWVTGCSVNLDKNLKEKIPGISEIFTNEEKEKIGRRIQKGTHKTNPGKSPRALLKVATGCNERCAYCVVPLVRGPVKSKKPEDILKEAQTLVAAGKKEIILTAINLGLYPNLKKLLQQLVEIPGSWRLRLSSLEPMYFTDELIEFLLSTPKICPHFYIPLQSGSPKILKLMGRRYTPSDFLKIIQKIKKINPATSINSDVIVGFPGETADDFKESYEFIKSADFSRIHVFPFSPRPGTAARNLKGKVLDREIKDRCQKMNQLRQKIMLDFHQKFVGQTLQILAEEFHPSQGLLEGLTDNYLRIFFKGQQNQIGELVAIKIKNAETDFLRGEQF